jgi:hypothetical protein
MHCTHEHFFGIMQIAQNNIANIKKGQQVIIKTSDYLSATERNKKGVVDFIATEPGKNGLFSVKIDLNTERLKSWMNINAEIVTSNVSLADRIYKSIFGKIDL